MKAGRPVQNSSYFGTWQELLIVAIYLADQRREIEEYARKNGYETLRWFKDDAISGDDTEKRLGFQEMYREASNGRDFDHILVYHADRFSRAEPQEASYWAWKFSEAGIEGLTTVSHGLLAWDDFTGWLTYSIGQNGNHEFLRNLSRTSTRGRISRAMQG